MACAVPYLCKFKIYILFTDIYIQSKLKSQKGKNSDMLSIRFAMGKQERRMRPGQGQKAAQVALSGFFSNEDDLRQI